MKWIIALLIVCLGWLQYRLWVGEGSVAEVVDLQYRIDKQQVEIDRLRERNRLLALEVDELKSGLEVIEERARSEMGMIKDGETFFMVVEEESGKKHSNNANRNTQIVNSKADAAAESIQP